ncbi:MAG: ABC transporter permease [Candidatus Brockarchaeota archaeon]|nr:ABC transporter permease [Candidatus Brockarchaeota archaeon]
MNGFLALTFMSSWRRIKEITRYKVNFALETAMSFVWGLGLLVFAAVADPGKLQYAIGSANYPIFLLIGVAFQTYQGASTWGAWEIHDELTKGQIEYTFASPVSRYFYILSHSLSQAIVGTIFGLLPMFALAVLLLGALPSPMAMAMMSISVILTFLALCQVGVVIASALLALKNVNALMQAFNFLLQIATGMFVPVQFMPEPIKALAFALPMTHGIDLSRHFILGTSTVWPVEVELAGLVILLLVFGALAKFSTAYLERKAKMEGLSLA